MPIEVYADYNNIVQVATEHTYQGDFELNTQCIYCKQSAILIIVLDDTEKELANQRPLKAKIWPHDSVAIALYLCDGCGEITAVWNQA